MATFRLDSLATLARQMSFTPSEARLSQLTATEQLLQELDPSKAYPLEYVVFRITGYHPRQVAQDLLTGLALQHDLGLLIEQVSEGLELFVQASAEPVLSIDDVTATFNVTSKTVQRWRRRGLPARRFTFPDGKRRVGFLLSSVERFFAAHRDQVVRNANFSQLGECEQQYILRRARQLATENHCWAQEIARRLGRRLNRSPLTILHTLRQHDQHHPQQPILPLAAEPIAPEQRTLIIKAHRRGLTLQTLAQRTGRPRWAIYRVLLEDRIGRLNRRRLRFIDDELYHQPDAMAAIEAVLSQEPLAGENSSSPEESRIPRDLPPYLGELCRTPLLSRSRERGLFLKLNYHKFQFGSARRRLDPEFASRRDLDGLERYLRQATEVKNAIIRANLRLVVSTARKHLRPGLSLMELVSDGNLTLMRAVDGFDIHKGTRFSTYATLALMKGFARSVPQLLASRLGGHCGHADEQVLAEVADPRPTRATERLIDREQVRQLLERLDERERGVLQAHYGLRDNDSEPSPATYEQVGRRLGLSKQRVRQIEQAALAKLRAVVHSPAGAA